MDEVLTTTLRHAILTRLAQFPFLVENADEAPTAAGADTEIVRLAAASKDLPDEQALDAHGRCSCSRRRRRTRGPVRAVAHRLLIGADVPARAVIDRRGGRHAQHAHSSL